MELPEYEQAILTHRAYLVRLIRHLTHGSQEDAEDTFQAAIVKVDYSIIDLQKASCKTYLTQAIKWQVQMERRGHKERLESLDEMGDETAYAPQLRQDAPQDDEVLRAEVNSHLQRIALPERTVIELWLEGHTFEEIASQRGVSRQRAHQLWQRGVEALRRGVLGA